MQLERCKNRITFLRRHAYVSLHSLVLELYAPVEFETEIASSVIDRSTFRYDKGDHSIMLLSWHASTRKGSGA